MSAVRECPILFSGEMIRPLLDGRKTQTRRVVKIPNYATFDHAQASSWDRDAAQWRANHPSMSDETLGHLLGGRTTGAYLLCNRTDGDDGIHVARCPHGEIGDRLWVRETFMGPAHIGDGEQGCVGFGVLYRADNSFVEDRFGCGCEGPCSGVRIEHPWKPSIFMPRWASRLTLKITDVRVERVQSISEEDAKAEGITEDYPEHECNSFADGYRWLWDSLNAKRGYGWDVNPWVWALSFGRVDVGGVA
jgi:hypothetical protein